ncbi:MAG: flagellar assembly peptidoglycan hydrolase FlgJ [Gammaproteobacteria bacterium]|nr:flagellar assembly peptidoglycan hydrolase FlgJ [Gammaproteobacteria bacterium]
MPKESAQISNETGAYFDLQRLDSLRSGARANSPEAVRKVAKEFESIFLKMMLKSMRDASLGDPLLESDGTKFYQSMFDDQIAVELSKTGTFGLADMLVQQMSPAQGQNRVTDDMGAKSIDWATVTVPVNATAAAVEKAMESYQKTLALKGNTQKHESGVVDTTVMSPMAGFSSAQEFAAKLWPMAQQASEKLGITADVLIAQAALETGWGRYISRKPDGSLSHNLFNIKADSRWDGAKAWKETNEFRNGRAAAEVASFRAYDSYQQSFDDYVDFIKQSPRYSRALNHSGDGTRYINELQVAGYATDPQYAKKIQNIMQRETIVLTGSQFNN